MSENTPESKSAKTAAKVMAAGNEDITARVISNEDGQLLASAMASGSGAIVASIEELAARYDIPLLQDALLTNLATGVPSGEEIPDNVYKAIAEVLNCVYRIVDEP